MSDTLPGTPGCLYLEDRGGHPNDSDLSLEAAHRPSLDIDVEEGQFFLFRHSEPSKLPLSSADETELPWGLGF